MSQRMKRILYTIAPVVFLLAACSGGNNVVRYTNVAPGGMDTLEGVNEEDIAQIEAIKEKKLQEEDNLKNVIQETQNFSVTEYLAYHPEANNLSTHDFSVGGYDVIDIMVYEEPDLSMENVRISANGYISFPLIGRVHVEGLTASEIEDKIARKLSDGEFILDAHVSVTVKEYKSKQFFVLGSVNSPGTYALQARERLLNAISKAGGIDFEQGGKEGMIIRTENPDTPDERKIVIRIELNDLLKGGDQLSNLLLKDNDLLYIPKAEFYYLIGQVQSPGSFPYLEKEITLVEAISKAGGFTELAARNKTRIIRMEDGVEQIIEVKVDKITESGLKGQDIPVRPGDVIVVPERFF